MAKRRYRLIEHTADIGLVAYGDSLREAFANAAYGMFSIMTDLRKVRLRESRVVEVGAEDREGLLFEWLNNLLYLFDVDYLLLRRFEIMELETKRLKARCWGERYEPSRHTISLGVKSATYHMLSINEQKNEVQVIFDV